MPKPTKLTFTETVKKIKSLEIQGAENIAIKAVEAFETRLAQTKNKLLLARAVRELSSARATEPALQNALDYCLASYEKDHHIAKTVLSHFKNSQSKISEFGASLIKNKMKIFTHCHSSSVERILIKAHRQGKRFEVYNTETRPRFQGRITATTLAKAGIRVTHCVDSASRQQLRKCDLFLIGCDAITKSRKVINKIGTESLFDAAQENRIPVYVCTNSWKFDTKSTPKKDTKIEERDPHEVWDSPPRNVKIFNPAFEKIDLNKVKGVITELGILKPKKLIRRIRKTYPYIWR